MINGIYYTEEALNQAKALQKKVDFELVNIAYFQSKGCLVDYYTMLMNEHNDLNSKINSILINYFDSYTSIYPTFEEYDTKLKNDFKES